MRVRTLDLTRESRRVRLIRLLTSTTGAVSGGLLAALAIAIGAAAQVDPPVHAATWMLDPDRGMPLAAAAVLVGAVVGAAFGGARWAQASTRAVFGALVGAACGAFVFGMGLLLREEPVGLEAVDAQARVVAAAIAAAPAGVTFAAVGGLVGFVTARYRWRATGVVAYTALASVVLGYIAYTLTQTLPAVRGWERAASVGLFAIETTSLALVLVYAFYSLDVSSRKRWRNTAERHEFSKYFIPKVAFHVATYNEPPTLLRDTLDHLVAVDYPRDRMEIIVVDDSDDTECALPLKQLCAERGVTYLHRDDRSGFKAGALNEALRHTALDVDLIAVIDADYQVDPPYLRETVGHFIDPELAFLQTPQAYRNEDESFLTRQYAHADAYFYRAILPSRNEENAIIFCGTMGILRRRAVEGVGGWGESYICEDAELSLRLLRAGHRSLYVDRTYGRGLIPGTFGAYQKQHSRWAFGGVKILKDHLGDFFSSNLTRRQRFDFLVGSLHWFDGVFVTLIALVVAAIGLAEFAGIPVVTHHSHEVWLLGLVPVFLLVDGLTRLHLALRRAIHVPFGGTLRVLGMWFAIKIPHTRAALQSLVGVRAPFVRTPKGQVERASRAQAALCALRLTVFETAMLVVMLATFVAIGATVATSPADAPTTLARGLLMTWALYYAAVFACAPVYAYMSYSTRRGAEGDATRQESAPSVRRRRGVAAAGVALVAAVAFAARMIDPISSPVIGAEDPYIHMERAWDLVQGRGLPRDYPPGFAALLSPFALLGPDALRAVARFGPPVLGVVEVVGVYLLARSRLTASASLASALAVALMPENVARTDLLFPTALDLALLPFALLSVIRASEGSHRAAASAFLLAVILAVTHPWVLALCLPPLILYSLVLVARDRRRAVGAIAVTAATATMAWAALAFLPGVWNPTSALLQHMGPRLAEIVADPLTILPLPVYVDYVKMLTWPLLALAAVGVVGSLASPSRLGLLAWTWCGVLLPLSLVDWFGIWFMPHRSVAYLSLGVAIFVGIAVDSLARLVPRRHGLSRVAGAAAVCMLFVAAAPATVAAEPWYRIYDEDDYEAWRALDERESSLVMCGSWEARAGYRAMTGRDAAYEPAFFADGAVRNATLAAHPDLVVLIDHHARESGTPAEFLAAWDPVLIWRRGAAYDPPGGPT